MKTDREMYKDWVRRATWHPYGVYELLEQYQDGRFVSQDIEAQFEGFCAGLRKGIKIQKEKSNAK